MANSLQWKSVGTGTNTSVVSCSISTLIQREILITGFLSEFSLGKNLLAFLPSDSATTKQWKSLEEKAAEWKQWQYSDHWAVIITWQPASCIQTENQETWSSPDSTAFQQVFLGIRKPTIKRQEITLSILLTGNMERDREGITTVCAEFQDTVLQNWTRMVPSKVHTSTKAQQSSLIQSKGLIPYQT